MSTVLAMLTLLALFIAPIKLGLVANQFVLKVPLNKNEAEVENPYAPFLKDYKRKEKKQLWYAVLFFCRRFCMILVITLLPINRNTQIVAQLWTTLFIMCYLG